MSVPSTFTEPEDALTSRLTHRSNVDLPPPLGTEKNNALASLDIQVDVLEHEHVAALVRMRQIAYRNDRIQWIPPIPVGRWPPCITSRPSACKTRVQGMHLSQDRVLTQGLGECEEIGGFQPDVDR